MSIEVFAGLTSLRDGGRARGSLPWPIIWMPPDSPRDDFVGEADVRLNKEVMSVVNAEHDAAGAELSCVDSLQRPDATAIST